MNLTFLKMLQSMTELEDDPYFKTQNLEDANLNLKYPENVIVVASPTGKAPAPAPDEIRKTTVSAAMVYAVERAMAGGAKRCSIVVHEGMYIDPFVPKFLDSLEDFSMEIVGVKDVRIVFQYRCLGFKDCAKRLNVTLRNLHIHDRRKEDGHATIFASSNEKIELIGVKMSTPTAYAFCADGKGSRFVLSDCTLSRCDGPCFIMNGGGIVLNDCRIVGGVHPGILKDSSSMTARNTYFERPLYFVDKSHGILESCKFEGRCSRTGFITEQMFQNSTGEKIGLQIHTGSEVVLKGTHLNNYLVAVGVENTTSKVTLQNCIITNCIEAVEASFHASASVVESELHCSVIVRISHNLKGSVEFNRNKFRKDYNARFPCPVIVKDEESIVPCHDFDNVKIISHEKPIPFMSHSKEQSEFTKNRREEKMDKDRTTRMSLLETLDFFDNPLYKRCNYCSQHEEGEKFKFCDGCKRICYCSRKCQKLDWPDHKLICPKLNKK